MREDDLSYYRRRASEEAVMASGTRNCVVAAVHRELAAKYIRRAALLGTGPQLMRVDPPMQVSA